MSYNNMDFSDYIINESMKNMGERGIVLWGKFSRETALEKKLRLAHLPVAFHVDGSPEKQNNVDTFSPDHLDGKSDQYYVIIPLMYYESIKTALAKYGFEKDKDYHYFNDCIVEQRKDYYEDSHGNKVIGEHEGLHFVFSGFDSTIEIGEGSDFNQVKIICNNNANVKLGNNTKMREALIRIEDFGSLMIDDNFQNSGVTANGTVGLNIYIFRYTSVQIGKDCMFASDITLWTYDHHPIFDVRTGKNINSTVDILKEKKILIGDHVWIGIDAFILYNSVIGNGSVIGARSLVKGKIPNNCVAAGSPARVIRRDIAWSKKMYSEDIMDCGENYINLTEEE